MELYIAVGKANLKHNFLPHLLIALCFSLLAPVLMGMKGLDHVQVAQTLEMYIQLVGVILLVPIFMPDQDKNIRDLAKSKYMPVVRVHLIRLMESLLALFVVLGAFIIILYVNNPVFTPLRYYFGVLGGAVFLGALGIVAYSLSDNVAIAYMVPMVYYVCNYSGDKYLHKFYLFSMAKGSFDEKIVLGAAGMVLIGAGILYRQRRR